MGTSRAAVIAGGRIFAVLPTGISGKASLALFNELVETASIGVQH
jgi:hypothetical protein